MALDEVLPFHPPKFILSGLSTSGSDEPRVACQRAIIGGVASRDSGLPLLATLALADDATLDDAPIVSLVGLNIIKGRR